MFAPLITKNKLFAGPSSWKNCFASRGDRLLAEMSILALNRQLHAASKEKKERINLEIRSF
jgi:hypothetical protein